MSIKTTKRVVLGVIVSLVFAPFAAITPANAAAGDLLLTNSVTIDQGAIVAGSTTVTGTVDGSAAVSAIALKLTGPTGGVLYASSDGLGGDGTSGFTVNAVDGSGDATFSIASNLLLAPGSYTLLAVSNDVAGDLDTVAEIEADAVSALNKSVVFTVSSPATTSSPAANMDSGVYTTGNGAVLRVWRNTAPTAGAILIEAVTSPDSDIVSGDVYSGTVANEVTVANFGGNATAGAGRTFTFGSNITAAGTYSFIAFIDANGDGIRQASEPQTTVSFVVSGAASGISVSSSVSRVDDATATAVRLTVTVTDALGRPSTLTLGTTTLTGTNDLFTVQNITTAKTLTQMGFSRVGSTNVYIADLTTKGISAVNEKATTLTVDLDGSATTTADRGTASITSVQLANATEMQVTSQAGLMGTTMPIPAAGAGVALTADPAVVTSLEMTVDGSAGKWVQISITAGANTNVANITGAGFYKVLADGSVIVPIAITSPANAQSYTIAVNGGLSYVVTFATAAPAWTVGPNANYTLKVGTSSTVVGVLKDQYGRPYASKAVTITVTGRNPQAVSATTSATGSVSVTVADTYTATVLTTDTVTFNYTESATVSAAASRTITYTATGIVAASVVVTDDDANNAVTIDQVEATVGLPDSIVTYTATARTAAGAAVGAGALVTFTAGAGDVFVDGIASAVTDANGQATVQVFRRTAGNASVTAAIGGATGNNAVVIWSNISTDTRVVTITVDPAAQTLGKWVTVTATAVDRWGNPVAGATVTWTEVGPGRFVYPAQPSNIAFSLVTNAAGQASIDLKAEDSEPAGNNTVTASVDATTQTASRAGRVGTTVVTAIAGITDNSAVAGKRTDSKTVSWNAELIPAEAPSLSVAKSGARIFLTGTCTADEGDVIFYVKSPGSAWKELAKTSECFAGEFDANRKMPKNSKLYRVKQEGTGLFSNQVLVRP
jgi:hypothetical protein